MVEEGHLDIPKSSLTLTSLDHDHAGTAAFSSSKLPTTGTSTRHLYILCRIHLHDPVNFARDNGPLAGYVLLEDSGNNKIAVHASIEIVQTAINQVG